MKRLFIVLVIAGLCLGWYSAVYAATEITPTVTASSEHSSLRAEQTIDNNLRTYWRGNSYARPWWLRYDLQGEYNLERVTIWWRQRYGATDYEIQLSNDGTNWNTVLSGLDSSGASANPYEITHQLSGRNARYLRIYINREERYFPIIWETKIYAQDAPANQAPTAIINSITPNPAGEGETVTFVGSGIDPDGSVSAYSWRSSRDGALSTDSIFTTDSLSVGTHTIYFRVEDNEGAQSNEVSQTLTITSNQAPQAIINANPTSGEAPLEVYFEGNGTDQDGIITGYSWNFGNGATSNDQNPTHIYNDPGSFLATLTVTDDDGATGAAAISITVEEPYVPPAEIPKLMGFQARLADIEENSLTGAYSITFRLYDTEVGGTVLWQETQDVYVEEGLLDVELGAQTELDLPFDRQYWLGVEVGSDGEMSPWFKLKTVPYSFQSAQ